MTTGVRISALLALSLMLGACAADTSVRTIYRAGSHSRFAYAAGGRDMTTLIIGNPFALPKDQADRAITDSMQGKNNGPLTKFTTRPSENARPRYRIVMMFNPPLGMNTAALCGDTGDLKPQATVGRIKVFTAFCSGGMIISDVRASLPAAAPTDPAFGEAIGRITRRLIPRRDPESSSDRCFDPPC